MPKIKLLTSVGGRLGDHESPKQGDVLEVEEAVAAAWADGTRAELVVEEEPEPVTAPAAPEPQPAKKTAARKTTKRASKTVETTAGEGGPEKR